MPPFDDLAVSDDLRRAGQTVQGLAPAATQPGQVVAPMDRTGALVKAMGDTAAEALPKAYKAEEAQAAELKERLQTGVGELQTTAEQRAYLKAPLPPPPQPPPQQPQADPLRAWGDPAMGLAMLASAFTRRPLTNALNAAAGVMQAYNKGDATAYKNQYQQWKDQTQYAMDLYQYKHEAYKDAIDLIDKDEKTAIAKITITAKALGDHPMERALAIAGGAGALELTRQRSAAVEAEKLANGRLRQQYDAQDAQMHARQQYNAAVAAGDQAGAAHWQQVFNESGETLKILKGGETPPAPPQPGTVGAHVSQKEREYLALPENAGKTEAPADLKEQWAAGFKKDASSRQDFGTPHEFQIVDKDTGKIVEEFRGVESRSKPNEITRTDTGQLVQLKPNETVHAVTAATGARQAQQVTALRGAGNEAVRALQNLVELPMTVNMGPFMGTQFKTPAALSDALKNSFVRGAFTDRETKQLDITFSGVSRSLGILENQGRASGVVGIADQMEKLRPQSGDDPLIVMRRYAEIRQVIDAAMENAEASGKPTRDELSLFHTIRQKVAEAVPYTVHDVNELERARRAKKGGVKPESADEFAKKMFANRDRTDLAKQALQQGHSREEVRKIYIESGGRGEDFDALLPAEVK